MSACLSIPTPVRTDSASWYAVQVITRREKATALQLEYRGYECFLPLRRNESVRQQGDKNTLALFSGYLFCRLDLSDCRMPVVGTPGVIRLVGFGEGPITVPELEIESLRALMTSTLRVDSCDYVHVGDKVRIGEGPLRGVEGYVDSVKSQCRLVVRITLLQRAVSVEVDRCIVEPLSPAAVAA